jgi:hypothetical protein
MKKIERQNGLTKGARRSDPEAVRIGDFFLRTSGAHRSGRDGGGDGGAAGRMERRRRGVMAVEEVLLGRPGPAAGRGSVPVAGNARRPGSSAGSGEVDVKS